VSRAPLGLAAAAAATAAGVAVVRRRRSGTDGTADGPTDRWHTVTINLPPEQVSPDGRSPEPLRGLGDGVEVEMRPAPGGRGTELAARLLDAKPGGPLSRLRGTDPRQALRSALREAKQILETGEVLQANDNRTSHDTLLNRPLQAATDRAGGEGRL
jgi:hypothetical protein